MFELLMLLSFLIIPLSQMIPDEGILIPILVKEK